MTKATEIDKVVRTYAIAYGAHASDKETYNMCINSMREHLEGMDMGKLLELV